MQHSNFVHGIHHITAIARIPQRTVDFCTHILGLRLVKKSVNQDDVQTYHFFFGDKTGEPGMDLTFFTFDRITQGSQGVGQVTTTALAVPEESLQFWQDRLKKYNCRCEEVREEFGYSRFLFYDFDQQGLEMVGLPNSELRSSTKQVWTTEEVSIEHAIRHFHSARLSVASFLQIEDVLTEVLDYQLHHQDEHVRLYRTQNEEDRAIYLEVEESPDMAPGVNASGTIHHIAFRVSDVKTLNSLRSKIQAVGLYPTEVIDRYYFKSVYFRTKAGILCELATDGPGFTADEKESELGKKLALPPFLEDRREEIEAGLEHVSL